MTQITAKQIQKILSDCKFNPREKQTVMNIVAEVGNPEYLKARAMEALIPSTSIEEIKFAIKILALLIAVKENEDAGKGIQR